MNGNLFVINFVVFLIIVDIVFDDVFIKLFIFDNWVKYVVFVLVIVF